MDIDKDKLAEAEEMGRAMARAYVAELQKLGIDVLGIWGVPMMPMPPQPVQGPAEATMVIGGVDVVYSGLVDSRAPDEIRRMLNDHWGETGCVMSIDHGPRTWLFDPKQEFWKIPMELFAYESPKALTDEDLSRQVHVILNREQITFVVPENNTVLRDLAVNILNVLKLKDYIKKE